MLAHWCGILFHPPDEDGTPSQASEAAAAAAERQQARRELGARRRRDGESLENDSERRGESCATRTKSVVVIYAEMEFFPIDRYKCPCTLPRPHSVSRFSSIL